MNWLLQQTHNIRDRKMTNNTTVKIAVLNTDKKEITWIPIAQKSIVDANIIGHGLSVNMPTISNENLLKISDQDWFVETIPKDNEDYFVMRYIDHATKADACLLSDLGCRNVYQYLECFGFTIREMIEQMPKVIAFFTESECELEGAVVANYNLGGKPTSLCFEGLIKYNPIRMVENIK